MSRVADSLKVNNITIGAGIPATDDEQAQGNATLSLVIPGKVLYLSALLNKRKFRKKGDKDGALAGLRVLEKANLGKVESTNPKRGTSAVSILIGY